MRLKVCAKVTGEIAIAVRAIKPRDIIITVSWPSLRTSVAHDFYRCVLPSRLDFIVQDQRADLLLQVLAVLHDTILHQLLQQHGPLLPDVPRVSRDLRTVVTIVVAQGTT